MIRARVVLVAGLLACASAGAGRAHAAAASAADSVRVAPASERHFWLPTARESAWLAPDKRLHATLSAALYCAIRLASDDPALAAGGAAGAGVAKELHDSWMRPPGPRQGASWRDLAADAAGILVAAALWSAID